MTSTASRIPADGGDVDDLSDPSSIFFLRTLLDSFRRNADRVALIDTNGSLTYAELLDQTFRLARALEMCGLGRGCGVAAIEDNTRGILLTWLATKVLGCYFV